MAETTSLCRLILSFLLIHLSVANGVYGYGEKTLLSLKLHECQWKQNSGIPNSPSQRSRRENGATILEMKHRDYLSGPKIGWNEKLQKSLISDEIRVNSLQTMIKNRILSQNKVLSQTKIPLSSGIKLQTLNYIVKIQLGGKNMTVIVDTGSDLTWVQCQPCKLCYNQQDPLFDPSSSPSYRFVSCNSPSCQSLQFSTGNSGICGSNPQTCNYLVGYGDGSYTRGELASENLKIGDTHVQNFVFGCGRNNKGLFGGASGLVGLGRSNISLISQTSSIFNGVFSYCLPSTDTGDSGSLILGDDFSVYKNSTSISFTTMVQNPLLSSFYLLNLTGISIGGVDLKAPSFNIGGLLIDSGTVITRLQPSIYTALKAEFLKQFSGFPPAPRFSILETCFNLSGYDEVNIPTVRMKFQGDAELDVDVHGIFYFAKSDASQVCLAISSLTYENDIAILGNYQQRNTRVVYDIKDSKLGFAQEVCSLI